MSEFDELLRGASSNLQQILSLANRLDLRYREMPPSPWGVGVGVLMSWDDLDWIVLTIPGADEGTLYITAGIRRDVNSDRLATLEVCNRVTRNNPAYPVFLHDAELGPDVFMQVSLAVEAALDPRELIPNPNGEQRPLIEHMCLSLPAQARQARQEIAEDLRIGGSPYMLDRENVERLFNRSML